MKVNLERIDKHQVSLEIEVAPEKFDESLDKAFKTLVKKINIPGFRKGKVPRAIFEAKIGKEALYEEAVEKVLPEAYEAAVKETTIEPIDHPQIELVQVEAGKPFIFKAKVDVKPEVTLGQYKGFELKKEVQEVTDEQVEQELNRMQQRHAKLTTVDGSIEKGDLATIDFAGYIDGEQFPGGTGTDYQLEIGSKTFIDNFEDQLIGLKAGDIKDVNVTFPENYHAAELAGKPAVFKVTVKEVKRKELAPLDDEFAKDVSEFETLDELKSDIRNKLKQKAEALAENQLKNEVINKVVEGAEVDIPQKMIEGQIDTLVGELEHSLQHQGMSMDIYFKITNKSAADLRDEFKPQAEKQVKTDLVLEAVAKQEKIDATDDDIKQEIEKFAKIYNQNADQMRMILESQGKLDVLKKGIVMEKTVKFLVDNNTIL